MKRFYCCCGNEVFFENYSCVSCRCALGFDPDTLQIHTLLPRSTPNFESKVDGRIYRFCANFTHNNACNWLIEESDRNPFCKGCRLNRTIPDLKIAINLNRWRDIERAKKRLLYSLYSLHLPVIDPTQNPERGLLFDFLEDNRSDHHHVDDRVNTGHLNGVITINVLEADHLHREKIRRQMHEPYRTLLGHFRHEIGHYYWDYLFLQSKSRSRFRKVFGNDQIPYAEALERYYKNSPIGGWEKDHISAYAASHPLEDWAESWAHYLHMQDMLETARVRKVLITPEVNDFDIDMQQWVELAIVANELNRSMGQPDVYPFVISTNVRAKLNFIHRMVQNPIFVD
ncbi:MAG: putative zinc-binding peptidase [Methylococcaceae bacterium]|nr:putative zinc-binding peptidase [Methylococcaceae bacterium]